MPRTLIVYLHGIGDNIMLSGVLKEFCQRHPGEIIDLVVLNAGCAAIWENNPRVGSVTVYPARQPYFWNPALFYPFHQWPVRRYIRELNRGDRYQRVLFPTIQTLPEIIYHLTGTYGRHKLDRLSRELGVPEKLYPYDLYPPDQELAAAAELVARFGGKPLAVLHPFSGHTKKHISAGGIREILHTLQNRGFTTLVVGSPGEKSRLDPGWQTESAFGLPFGTLIGILKRAEIFAGADSAVAHLAAFAGTPRVVIFSPKLKPERYLPVGEQSRIFVIRVESGAEAGSLAEFRRVLETR
jgi:ADP-heptose:LPS heptosyltransferase